MISSFFMNSSTEVAVDVLERARDVIYVSADVRHGLARFINALYGGLRRASADEDRRRKHDRYHEDRFLVHFFTFVFDLLKHDLQYILWLSRFGHISAVLKNPGQFPVTPTKSPFLILA